MPHIVVEYSAALDSAIPPLLEKLHAGLAACGVDVVRIKTRGVPLHNAVVGDKGTGGLMVHATVLLLEGRDVALRKSYGESLYGLMKDHLKPAAPDCAVTLEIREMCKDTYFM